MFSLVHENSTKTQYLKTTKKGTENVEHQFPVIQLNAMFGELSFHTYLGPMLRGKLKL